MKAADTEELLEQIKKIFEENDVACVMRTPAEEPVLRVPILTTLHRNMGNHNDEVMGEYLFAPHVEGADEYFTISLSITENLTEETYGLFSAASGVLNFYLPFGCFILNRDITTFAYKYTVIIPSGYTKEQAFELMDKAIGGALDIVDNNIAILADMERGTATFEDFLELMPSLRAGE